MNLKKYQKFHVLINSVKLTNLVMLKKIVYPVRFSALDMNGHVNNAKYYDWAADMVDFEFRKSHQPKHVFIKYNHEVLYGEEINALMSWEDEVSHHNFNDGSTQIEIHWGKV